jgi:hypothetical protein
MTLVANFSVDRRPVLLGDLMLSCADDGQEYKPFTTPLHLDPNREVRGNVPYIVAGLAQKVILLTPRLAVAWAGLMSQAEYAIKNLQEHLADVGYSVAGLVKFLDERCKSCDELYLTGLMTLDAFEGNLPVARFSWPRGEGEQFVSARFGDCYGQVSVTFHSMIKYAYEEDRLLVRRLVPYLIPSTPIDDCFVISPVHRRPSDEDKAQLLTRVKAPLFESRISVLYCHVPQAPLPGRILHLIHCRASDGETPVVVLEHDDCLEIQLSPALLHRVGNMVQRAVAGRSAG